MTNRTTTEQRLLLDAAQVAIAVGGAVSLALPWVLVYARSSAGVDRNVTGWGGLSSSQYGSAWLLIAAVAVALLAVGLDKRVARIVAAVLAALATVLMLLSARGLDSTSGQEVTSGIWLAAVLLAATALVQGLSAGTRG